MIRNEKKLSVIAGQEDHGRTLGQYLHRLGFTRAQIRSMKFRPDGLCIDGRRVRVTHVMQEGEWLDILLEDADASSDQLIKTEDSVTVLYEDSDVIAVWKEAGLVLHPSQGHYCDTLSNRLHTYLEQKGERTVVRSIGRLDRDTAGIVVFAKNQIAAARLWQQKEDGRFWKEYLALCSRACGSSRIFVPDRTWHTVCTSIGSVPGGKKMCVTPDGKAAVTYYQLVRSTEKTMLFRVRIETGRTHQIRVHLSSVGYPLAGDPIYGDGIPGKTTTRLCAWRAELEQPFTGKKIRLSGRIDDAWKTEMQKD